MSERDTVAPHTARHPVTPVSLLAQTDRPVLSCQVISPGLAVGVGTAGVRSAEIGGGEGAAGDKGVSCVSPGAGADCLVAGGLAVSVEATGRPASVHVVSARSVLFSYKAAVVTSASVHIYQGSMHLPGVPWHCLSKSQSDSL